VQRVGLTQALGSSGFCEKQLQVAYGSPGCFVFPVSLRENWLFPQRAYLVYTTHSIAESGTLTSLPPHGTASPSRRSGGKVGKLAHPSPTHVTACLRSIFRPSSRNVTGSLNTLRRCSQGACACSTCVQAAGSVAVAAGLAIKATFA